MTSDVANIQTVLITGDAGSATSPSSRKTGKRLPDPAKRDTENVPLNEDINAYLEREVA